MIFARAALKIGGFLILSALLIPVQVVAQPLPLRLFYNIPCFWHRTVCRLFGLRVRVSGQPVQGGHILYVSNHLSYMDIPVLGAILPASFVAKKEVADWPFLGILARLQKTVFVDRARSAAKRSGVSLSRSLAAGRPMILFPEGTSSDGQTVLPFRSTLFSVLEDFPETVIQPVTIRLEGVETREDRDAYAWYGDMELLPHLWAFAKREGARVHVTFHAPVFAKAFQGRKEIALAAYQIVTCGLERLG